MPCTVISSHVGNDFGLSDAATELHRLTGERACIAPFAKDLITNLSIEKEWEEG